LILIYPTKKKKKTENGFFNSSPTPSPPGGVHDDSILSELRRESDVQNLQKPFVIDVASENPNECSICLEDSETGHFVKLACRHRFCLDCVRNYLVVKINENDVPFRHKMITIQREGQAL
jgi:hypothetical protein